MLHVICEFQSVRFRLKAAKMTTLKCNFSSHLKCSTACYMRLQRTQYSSAEHRLFNILLNKKQRKKKQKKLWTLCKQRGKQSAITCVAALHTIYVPHRDVYLHLWDAFLVPFVLP